MTKPKFIKQVEKIQKKRADGRTHTSYRDLYECPRCQNHYEALRDVINVGSRATCGACTEPVTSSRLAINLPYYMGKQKVAVPKQAPPVLELPTGAF